MPRPRTGSAFIKGGKIVCQIRLREDAAQKHWQTQCPPRPDGRPVTLDHAKAVAANLQERYDGGTFDPMVKEAAEPEPVPEKEIPTVAAWATEWAKAQTYERATKDQGSVERYIAGTALGSMWLTDVRPRHVAEWLKTMAARPSRNGGTLSPRTITDINKTLRRALTAAVFAEILASNPCDATRAYAPGNGDKDPLAREGWIFSRGEIYKLMTSPVLPADRRVVYALESLTGCRPGELATLRWRDWDRTITPLTRLMVARAQSSVSQTEGATKTKARKAVPVHPYLESVVTAWFATGWAEYTGRAPTPDDLICPNRYGHPRKTTAARAAFTLDLKALGLVYRRHYALRHTFISLAQDDGASGEVLRWATHAPPSTAFAGYTRGPWKALCAEIVKLRVGPDEPPAGPAPAAGGGGGGLTASLTARRKAKSENTTKQAVADQTRGRYQ